MPTFTISNNQLEEGRASLTNAYLIGRDGNPVRGDITCADNQVQCTTRDRGPIALAMQQDAGGLGKLTLQTCLLPEREEPYLLILEQARHRLMVLYNKFEEWGMFDLEEDHPAKNLFEQARKLFIEALCLQNEDPGKTVECARKCLEMSIDGSERLSLEHSQLLLDKRIDTGSLSPLSVGCGIDLHCSNERLHRCLSANFDFVQLRTPWRDLVPREDEYDWQILDSWVEWAGRNRLPVIAGPILSFDPLNVPDWLYIWEHDYDTVRELIYEHAHRLASRYKNHITGWKAVSGLHINNHFSFNFDQVMDLTRMVTMQIKHASPRSRVIVELCQPFAEYYSANPRSIPPIMYSQMLIDSSLNFDLLGVELLMGQAQPGQYTRDMLQISDILRRLAALGKPLILSAAAPSCPITSPMLPVLPSGEIISDDSGYWRDPWSEQVQQRWVEELLKISLSKPYVESVAWANLVDHSDLSLPLSGLIGENLEPKKSFEAFLEFRQKIRQHKGFGVSNKNVLSDNQLEPENFLADSYRTESRFY